MRGSWDDGGLVPEGAVMADVQGAITCAFMPPSSGHTRVGPCGKPSLAAAVDPELTMGTKQKPKCKSSSGIDSHLPTGYIFERDFR